MAHVAWIDPTNVVVAVHCIDNADLPNNGTFDPTVEQAAREHQRTLGFNNEGYEWYLTSYNGNFRGRFAAIGCSYDPEVDEFSEIPPDDPFNPTG